MLSNVMPEPTLRPRGPVRVEDPLSEGVCVLEEYGLEIRIINTLEGAGFLWIEDLSGVTAERLLAVGHVGELCVEKIRRALRDYLEFQYAK